MEVEGEANQNSFIQHATVVVQITHRPLDFLAPLPPSDFISVSALSVLTSLKTPLLYISAMSRKVTIEEEFDDETDLPLPARPLPNMGSKGAILEEITSSGDEDDFDMNIEQEPTAGPATPSRAPRPQSSAPRPQASPPLGGQARQQPANSVTDITPYKKSVVLEYLSVSCLIIVQVDLHLSYLYRRETTLWYWGTSHTSDQCSVVAVK